MATTLLAMWLQQPPDDSTRHLVFIFIAIICVSIAALAVAMMVVGLKAMRAIKDVSETAQEFKAKIMPLLDEVNALTRTSRELLQETAPKVKIITENLAKSSEALVETSRMAKETIQQIDTTVADANIRARRQVARVDSMVTAALTTTAEVVETINHGIRVPAQKIAVIAGQTRVIAEDLFAKFRSIVAASPFGGRASHPEL